MFASYLLYAKSFYIERNHISFGMKNPSFFSKNPNLVPFEKSYFFSRILRIKKYSNSEPGTCVKSDIINWRKCDKMFTFSVSSGPFSFHIQNLAENKRILSESKNHDGQHLNVSPTMPKTKTFCTP